MCFVLFSYPIEKILDAADYYILRSKKRILIEYVMLSEQDGTPVNSSDIEAHQLGVLLKGKEVVSWRCSNFTERRAL